MSLASAIDRLSGSLKTQLTTVSEGIRGSYGILQEIASTDMSEQNLAANTRISMMMNAMLTQSSQFAVALDKSARTSKAISSDIAAAVVAMQFQDRAMQLLENVSIAVDTAASNLCVLDDETAAQCPVEPNRDRAELIADQILQHCTLGEIHQRLERGFGRQVSNTTEAASSAAPGDEDEGGIELF